MGVVFWHINISNFTVLNQIQSKENPHILTFSAGILKDLNSCEV